MIFENTVDGFITHADFSGRAFRDALCVEVGRGSLEGRTTPYRNGVAYTATTGSAIKASETETTRRLNQE